MENPARTAAHLEKMRERRQDLGEALNGILVPHIPITLEIGCGHGHFLTAYAHAHSTETCIGIDISSERIGRAMRKRGRANLTNLHFLQAEARLFLATLPPDARIAKTYVLFPDPWPKKRHHKHRLMQAEFLGELAAKSTPGATLYYRTDFEPYFEQTAEILRAHADWQLLNEGGAWPFEYETVFQNRAPKHRSFVAQRRHP